MGTNIILAVVAVVGLLITTASVMGTFRVSRNTQTVSTYREAAQAWQTKAEAQEEVINDLKTQLAEANAKIEELSKRVQMLQDVVTSRSIVEALAHELTAHHTTVTARFDSMDAAIRHLAEVFATWTSSQSL